MLSLATVRVPMSCEKGGGVLQSVWAMGHEAQRMRAGWEEMQLQVGRGDWWCSREVIMVLKM